MGGFAWVTLATNDSYSLGALVLAHSLKAVGTTHQLAVLVTPGVTSAMRDKLSAVFNLVQEVNILDSRDEANLRLLKRPELGITFTKLHCWRLTQYEKCVFLDADTLVLQYCDELFDREELSAAPDVGWPDCFNSGVFVYLPSLETYDKLIQFALEKGSFDGGDQGLLNLYFSDWAHKDISKHLPFIYNMCSTACYSYLPAYKQFGANAKIIHFIGSQKPWLQYFNTETRQVQPSGDSSHLQEVLQRWWDIFCSLIHPQLSPAMPQQLQHAVSPSYFPPQYAPPPNPTSSADDYENAWDPWDEYDQKIAQNSHNTSVSTHYIQNQPIESLNTNASHVADQPTIHSQPQSHNNDTNFTQNNSLYQPIPQPVYQHVPRVPTPPLSPQPQQHAPQYQQTQTHHHEPQDHHHYEPQNQSQPQFHHQSEPQYIHQPQHHQEHTQHEYFQHTDNQPHTNHPPEQSYHQNYHLHSHQTKAESFSPGPERPKSPNRPDPVPILPKECEATTTVSNDMSLNSTIEDCSKQDNAGLAGAFAQLTLGVPRTPEQDAFENVVRKQAWEVGNIDYLGRDSFDNIWSKISETLSTGPAPESAEPSAPAILPAPAESQSESAPPQAEAKPVQTPVTPVDTITSTPVVEKSIDQQQTPPSDAPTSQDVAESTKTQPPVTETSKVSESVKEGAPLPLEVPSTPKEIESVTEPTVCTEKKDAKETVIKVLESQIELPKAETKPAEPQADVPVTKAILEPKTEVSETETKVAEPQTVIPEKQQESITGVEACPLPQKKVEKAAESKAPEAKEAAVESACPLLAKKDLPKEVKKEEPKKSETQTVVPEPEQKQPQTPALQPDATKETIAAQEVARETPPSQEKPIETKPVQETPIEPPSVATKESATQPPPQPAVPQQSEVSPQLTILKESEVLPAKPEVATSPKDDSKPTQKKAPVVATTTADSKGVPSKDSPKTKVTEATPPVTPGSPLVEKTKEALAAEASIPDTPPPTEGGSTPTPPPRKTDKPKKVAAKPKK